jgi:drug/metabolite transporter (DMT)-like permease
MPVLSAPWAIVLASLLFATMGVCVKLASPHYSAGELVFYRSLTGALMMAAFSRYHGIALSTKVPGMHFWRSLTGVVSLILWFYALGNLPLATAVTLNYMSSVWMGLFLLGGAAMVGSARIDGRLIATVLVGFAGVALILRPTIEREQLWHGLMGLLSGMVAATAYLQLSALGRAGEPEARVVFYFSLAGIGAGLISVFFTGMATHTWGGLVLVVAIGVLATTAQWLMTSAYRTARPLVNASLQYLGIAFSFVYGVLLFGEIITPMAMAGIVLIVGAGLSATRLRSEGLPGRDPKIPSDT